MSDLLDLRPESSNGSQPPAQGVYEMDDSVGDVLSRSGSRQGLLGGSTTPMPSTNSAVEGGMAKGMAKHTLGLCLLLCVVFLWTLSNFLGSVSTTTYLQPRTVVKQRLTYHLQSIFADGTYDKPAFLTWLNSSSFMLAMVPTLIKSAYRLRRDGRWDEQLEWVRERYRRGGLRLILREDDDLHDQGPNSSEERESFLKPTDDDVDDHSPCRRPLRKRTHLAILPTARLAFFFCFLWFCANYFAMACLKYTTVASATILTSTSSIFTLLIGALTRTEKFTWRKLAGVVASLAGIVLISKVDLGSSTKSPERQRRALDEFPDKTPAELLLGDSLALFSAMIYGVYTITLKRTTLLHHPLQINMPLFFGLVGTFNFFLLLPLFPILHLTGIEPFALPPNKRIWTILLINSASSLASDICWAYAMILTSPLVVTVGLSLTIPLSLVGEMIIQGRFESWVYWVGAGIVVGSFIFVDREEKEDENEVLQATLVERHRRSVSLSGELGVASGSGVGREPVDRGSLDDR